MPTMRGQKLNVGFPNDMSSGHGNAPCMVLLSSGSAGAGTLTSESAQILTVPHCTACIRGNSTTRKDQ